MDIDWKKPAVVAAIAFFVAAISAAFGQVGFGALIFRSFLGAIVFGALTVGVDMLARKFLPELYGDNSESVTEASTGTGVNITLDEENPHSGNDDVAPPMSDDFDDGADLSDSEDVEELETLNEGEGATSDMPSGDGSLPSFGEVETTFDTAASHIDERDDSPPIGLNRSDTSVDILGEEQDPETVARAVRTLLKRDEEG